MRGLRHPLRQGVAALLALACAACGLWLAAHHPLSPALALVGVVAAAAAAFWRPTWALAGLLALLPWAGLMPWTGWLVVEEFDLLVLAVAAGGHARIAAGWPAQPTARMRLARAWLLGAPLLAATALAAAIGVADAGGLAWGWWQGYHEPLNSLRLAKPLLAVALLLPLWRGAWRADAAAATWAFQAGMVGMLGATALGVVWERLAFTGLLDFSSDYRATGLFWEMHVGGAALDAVLSASLPFALLAWRSAATPRRWALVALVCALGLYAALVTFSRIVYLGVPLGLGCTLVLLARQQQRQGQAVAPTWVTVAVAAALYLALAWWLFPGSGWRGQVTLLAAVALLLPLATLPSRSRTPWVPAALVFGLLAVMAVAALVLLAPKGAYLAFALAWLATATSLWRGRGGGLGAVVLSWAGFAGVLAALAAVGLHWGEGEGLERSLPVALVLAALAAYARRDPPWPADWRWQGRLLGLCLLVSAVVGVFGAGAYMGDRMTATRQDGEDRRTHWREALGLLRSPAEQFLGKGLGRFTAQRAMSGQTQDQIGDARLRESDDGARWVVLSGGKHMLGWGAVFRLSQRVAVPQGTARLRLRLRTEQAAEIQVDLCEKHLLYNAACLGGQRHLKPAAGLWQTLEWPLKGEAISGGPWYAPRLVVLSIGVGTPGARIEVDDLSLVDPRGEMLANGAFERGLARWFVTSDHNHLPWHAKNVGVHVLFEQGLLGAVAVLVLLLPALWRVTLGAARHHRLAPPLAGAMLGLLAVGMVDSLLDIPRVAFVAWWLLLVAVTLPGHRPAGPAPRRAP
ncbi:conserved membrane hypothetical protein [Rubrivivax sp. A210]|uniref:hypothetical protein n=1 Tax=Rubrivivax sp. A210 TaxID=2772301 RepID=UPI001919E9AD|nr:hypothetical protein [Rubrivivax sp. A210]CAD5375236.1 conserved membrane hypothetical protein [Rubrivivax sp. A210]